MPLALLFFNIGIEVGQIAFIFAILALWFVVRRPLAPWQERLLPVPVYILGESMGAAVVIATLARGEPLDAAGLILTAPAVWGEAMLVPLKRAMPST